MLPGIVQNGRFYTRGGGGGGKLLAKVKKALFQARSLCLRGKHRGFCNADSSSSLREAGATLYDIILVVMLNGKFLTAFLEEVETGIGFTF